MALTEDEWSLFETYCRTLDFGASEEEEVVFRGGKTYSLEYVGKPADDARVSAKLLGENPDLFQDAGFLVILPFAKSVELHLRLLYLGSSENTFKNGNFTVKGALKSLEVCLESGDFESLSHSGFKEGSVVSAHGSFKQTLVAKHLENPRSLKRVIRQMIHLSFKLYGKGNKYRHNAVKPWAEVSEEYQQASQLFAEFEEAFSKLSKV